MHESLLIELEIHEFLVPSHFSGCVIEFWFIYFKRVKQSKEHDMTCELKCAQKLSKTAHFRTLSTFFRSKTEFSNFYYPWITWMIVFSCFLDANKNIITGIRNWNVRNQSSSGYTKTVTVLGNGLSTKLEKYTGNLTNNSVFVDQCLRSETINWFPC